MKITVLCAGKIKEKYFAYSSTMFFLSFVIKRAREEKISSIESKREAFFCSKIIFLDFKAFEYFTKASIKSELHNETD